MASIQLQSFVVWVLLLASVSTVYAQTSFLAPASAHMRAVAAAASSIARTALPGAAFARMVGIGVHGSQAAGARSQRGVGRVRKPVPASAVVPMPRETPAFRLTFNILAARPDLTDRYDDLILKHSKLQGLDPRLVKSIIAAESEFSPKAVSPKGAAGLMQLMPRTAEEIGVPRRGLSDPEANIRAGTAYLALLFRAAWIQYKLKGVAYSNAPPWLRQRVIASYNAGPRSLTNRRWHRQTRGYVRKVLLFYQSPVADFRAPPRSFLAELFGA
ncbi:MAG: lytic transglycosylase domain-containing protein [Elusimicrobia bacterium]|nr:lytic transglycosylase domain-containing protein [Elusimicrobiota bacterium]